MACLVVFVVYCTSSSTSISLYTINCSPVHIPDWLVVRLGIPVRVYVCVFVRVWICFGLCHSVTVLWRWRASHESLEIESLTDPLNGSNIRFRLDALEPRQQAAAAAATTTCFHSPIRPAGYWVLPSSVTDRSTYRHRQTDIQADRGPILMEVPLMVLISGWFLTLLAPAVDAIIAPRVYSDAARWLFNCWDQVKCNIVLCPYIRRSRILYENRRAFWSASFKCHQAMTIASASNVLTFRS